jgi:hypothetical protein
VSDIVAFVLAQLDAELAAAEAASGLAPHWAAGDGRDGGIGEVFRTIGLDGEWRCTEHPQGVPNMCDDIRILAVDDDFVMDEALEAAYARHIAYWDPSRVLADIAAKRRLVEQYAEQAARCPEDDWPEDGDMSAAPLADHARWALKCLALPFAGRVGFDEAWRV